MKPHAESHSPLARFFKAFNSGFDWLNIRYGSVAALLARRTLMVLLTLGALLFVIGGLFKSVPSGFVPDEDKGAVFMQVVLPDAASQERTEAVLRRLSHHKSVPGVETVVSVAGFDLISARVASNGVGDRAAETLGRKAGRPAPVLSSKLYFAMLGIPEAIVMPFNPPALPGMGSVSGFSFMLQARANQSPAELSRVAQDFIAKAQQRPEIGRISTTFSASTPNYQLQVDREKAKKLGVPIRRAATRRRSSVVTRSRLHALRAQLQGDDAGGIRFPPGSQRHLAPVRA
jgi:multidrug efflux pump